jgi:prophage regulatory protein
MLVDFPAAGLRHNNFLRTQDQFTSGVRVLSVTPSTVVVDPLLRLAQVLAVFPVSRSAWYAGVRAGIYPAPLKIGIRAAAWRTSTIKELIDRLPTGSIEDAL